MDQEYITHLKNTYLPDDFSVLEHEKFNPEVWGPYYWFFLHTVAHTYPRMPNSVTKRKYYDLIQNYFFSRSLLLVDKYQHPANQRQVNQNILHYYSTVNRYDQP